MKLSQSEIVQRLLEELSRKGVFPTKRLSTPENSVVLSFFSVQESHIEITNDEKITVTVIKDTAKTICALDYEDFTLVPELILNPLSDR